MDRPVPALRIMVRDGKTSGFETSLETAASLSSMAAGVIPLEMTAGGYPRPYPGARFLLGSTPYWGGTRGAAVQGGRRGVAIGMA